MTTEPPVTHDELHQLERKLNGLNVPLKEYLDDKFASLAAETRIAREGVDFRCHFRHTELDKLHGSMEERVKALELSEAKLAGKASIKSTIFIGFIAAAGLVISAISLIVVLAR